MVGRPINLFRRINNTPNVKGVRISSLFEHPWVWTEMGSCWFSQLWPSQQKLSRYIELPWWTTQFWWRTTCMSLMAHVDGTQCGEVHLLYMERMGSFFMHALYLIFWSCLFRLGFLLLFSRVAVMLSTGCSQAGIPPLPLRGLLGEFVLYFSTSRLEAKHHYSVPALFL